MVLRESLLYSLLSRAKKIFYRRPHRAPRELHNEGRVSAKIGGTAFLLTPCCFNGVFFFFIANLSHNNFASYKQGEL